MNRRPTASALQPAPRPSFEAVEADEFSVAEVLSDGLRSWLSQLPSFAGIALILHAPLLLITLLPPLPGPLTAAIFLAGELVVALLVKCALVKAVLDARRGLPAEFVELLAALRGSLGVVVLGVRIFTRAAGRLVMIVPGLMYLAQTFAAVPALLVEAGSGGKALARSRQLTDGVRFQVLTICVLIWSLALGLTFLSGVYKAESLSNTTWILVYICARSLDTSLAAVLSATAYHHLSERPEAA
ncbi:MAG TPA: hypothetical protein VEP66_13560 [Myxococcales bacterium]|nr:hypothetical protein [Myxococcales bacterium]